MIRRGTALKLALLAAPLAAGVLSLHAFGEPLGRSCRGLLVRVTYPEHAHGAFLVRVRRGSDYHAFAAQTLDDFTRAFLAAYGPQAGIRRPERVTVLLLDSTDDLGRFGLDAGRLDQGGMADPATGTIALVGEGRTHQTDQDARALRHQAAHLLLDGRSPPWLVEGMASRFEILAPDAVTKNPRAALRELLRLATLFSASEADFRGPESASYVESARLFVDYLIEQGRSEFRDALRGGVLPPAEETSELETEWREWSRRRPK